MSKKKQPQTRKYRRRAPDGNKKERGRVVLDWWVLVFFVASVACLVGSITLFTGGELGLGVISLVIALVFALGVILSPLCLVFSGSGLTTVRLGGRRRVIPWYAIKGVIERKWLEGRGLPSYQIIYHVSYKGHVSVEELEIPRTGRMRILMERYAKHKIL